MKTEIETASRTQSKNEDSDEKTNFSLKKIGKRIVNEVKTWPIWAIILVCCAVIFVTPTLLMIALVLVYVVGLIVIGIPVFLFGDTFELLFYEVFMKAPLPAQIAIVAGLLLALIGLAAICYKKWYNWRHGIKTDKGKQSDGEMKTEIEMVSKADASPKIDLPPIEWKRIPFIWRLLFGIFAPLIFLFLFRFLNSFHSKAAGEPVFSLPFIFLVCIFFGGFVLMLLLILILKLSRKHFTAKIKTESRLTGNGMLRLAVLFSLLSCLTPFFVVHMGIFDDYTRRTEQALLRQSDQYYTRALQATSVEEKERFEQKHEETTKEYSRRYYKNKAIIDRGGWISGVMFAVGGMILGGRHLFLIRQGKRRSGFLAATFAAVFPPGALMWFVAARYLMDHVGVGMGLSMITNLYYYAPRGIGYLVGITVIVAGFLFLTVWLLHRWCHPRPKQTEARLSRYSGIASLTCLIVAILVFVIAAPVYYQLWKEPQIQAQQKYSICRGNQSHVRSEVLSNGLTIESLKKIDILNDSHRITNQFEIEAAEAELQVNEKWLEKRDKEVESARQELENIKGRETPLIRGLWMSVLGLPSVLLVFSLILGFAHLKRLRNETEKPGLIAAGLSLLVSPFLIPVFVTFTIVLFFIGG